jgi:hypothetical protein
MAHTDTGTNNDRLLTKINGGHTDTQTERLSHNLRIKKKEDIQTDGQAPNNTQRDSKAIS